MTSEPASTGESSSDRIEEAWRSERPYLQAMAARMLHSTSAAEDVVQEAFGRLARTGVEEIGDLRGWLMVVVRHLCLDVLGSVHARRATTPGWLDEGATPVTLRPPLDPADRIVLDDQVQYALALVIERLSPAERTAFVLHDVFGFPFSAVGELVGRTPAACRQLAVRARSSIRESRALVPGPAEMTPSRLLVERFIAACAGGAVEELMELLDPDVVGGAALEGQAHQVRAEGRDAVAAQVLRFLGPVTGRVLVPVPIADGAGVVVIDDGLAVASFRLDTRGGVIRHLEGVVRRDAARPGPH